MEMLLNLKHLNGAIEIRQRGSISRASDAVFISQSALTQGIRKIENEIGFELFTRFHDGLRITDAGRIFLRRAELALDYLRAMDQVLGRSRTAKSAPVARMLTTTQLRALAAVVDRQSYTRAAQHLRLAQPTVHKAVKHVESVCRTTLFRKSPAGLEATWPARQLARLIDLFFHELEQGLEEVEESRGRMRGRVGIGSLPLARTKLVPGAVTGLLREFPEARVRIVDGPYEELLHSLLHGRLDVIVGALRDPLPSPEICQRRLFTDSLSIAVRPGHPLAGQGRLSVGVLESMSWIAPREDTPARVAFTRFFESLGLAPPDRVVECSSLVATRGMLLDSDLAALLSAKQLEVEVQAGLLALCAEQLPATGREIGITTRLRWQATRMQERLLQLLEERA